MPNSFTLYLAKGVAADFSEYLTENARISLASPTTQALGIREYAERASIYLFQGPLRPPPWLMNLSRQFNGLRPFETRSGAAVLFFLRNGRVFAVTFSHGWMYLDEDMFESDFGLKVAVNALDQTKLRRLELANLGDALRGVSQSSFQRDFQSFGVDDALDLVRKISGATRQDTGLNAVTGSRSLKITGEYEVLDLPDLAQELMDLFASDAYQQTPFSIIDFVRPVADGTLHRQLNAEAARRIRDRHDNFELGMPSNLESEGVTFRFEGPRLRNSFPDLLLRHYVASLGTRLAELDEDTLDSHKIVAEFDENRPPLRWSIRKALVGSIDRDGERFAANEGQWYRVDDNFRQAVERAFQEIQGTWGEAPPPPPTTYYDAAGNGRIEREEDYTARLALHFNYVLLDQIFLTVPNAARSQFEVCDLLDVAGCRFIHIKKNSRRSNILSHFIKQGSNSARQFKRVPNLWQQLVDQLRALNHTVEAEELERAIGIRNVRWRVEYWIIDSPRVTGEFAIPFFSRITLRDEAMDLTSMEYDVELRFIDRPPEALQRFQRD